MRVSFKRGGIRRGEEEGVGMVAGVEVADSGVIDSETEIRFGVAALPI